MTKTKPIPVLTPRQQHNLNRRIDKSGGPDACWPWTGSTDDCGYGTIGLGDAVYRTHRVVASEAGFPPTADQPCILHSCDNPPCCNAAHLRRGTHAENMTDAHTKGRKVMPRQPLQHERPKGDTHFARRHPEKLARGERTGTSKLTEAQVRLIRADTRSYATIAADHGIKKSNVGTIKRGQSWKHIAAPQVVQVTA